MSYVSPRKPVKIGKQKSSLFTKPALSKAELKRRNAERQAKQQAYEQAVARWEASNS